jgi:hypothetical protein
MKRSMYACGVLFAAIGAAAIAVGMASGGALGAILFGLMFAAVAALFFWVGSWGVNDTAPLEDAELQRLGRPAMATVLEVVVPQIATDAAAAGTQVTLEVTPVNESAFRAKARLTPSRAVPRVGEQVKVKFDPNKRKHLIVMG